MRATFPVASHTSETHPSSFPIFPDLPLAASIVTDDSGHVSDTISSLLFQISLLLKKVGDSASWQTQTPSPSHVCSPDPSFSGSTAPPESASPAPSIQAGQYISEATGFMIRCLSVHSKSQEYYWN